MLEVLSIILIAVGVFLLLRGLSEKYEYEIPHKYEDREDVKTEKKVEAGGVVLIGPIPIVFGSSRMAVLALILTIVLMLIALFFYL